MRIFVFGRSDSLRAAPLARAARGQRLPAPCHRQVDATLLLVLWSPEAVPRDGCHTGADDEA